ncbi:FAD:protein FMN transferase [Deinococcus yavapaiensis]|uniref:FAD:protein FMN transferase n=1 Tax=Deinococcus yavapaiensis KR-236 TaxID=694435 RepID=A0A318S903_9DEIO|nr:FAD:protein FMN transferase [Deinococcus yavapaiensis]PYE54615.1 thiamine biosynthesis lipoprotein [Deinococcus yavapaiensis KR-236]
MALASFLRARALGTDVEIKGEGATEALREVRRLEDILTRFRESPLTRLNDDGVLPRPPIELVEALQHALHVARLTDGLVTPTVLQALKAAGYDERPGGPVRLAVSVPSTRGVVCDLGEICLPPRVSLDLGGTAKSWIVERAFRFLSGDAMLNAGGDLLSRRSEPFSVEIEHPFGEARRFLELAPGTWGIATSSLMKRAWVGGHHLIDPRTFRPVDSPLVQVTVAASSVTTAEVLAKLAFLDDAALKAFPLEGPAWLVAYDTSGRVLRRTLRPGEAAA